METGGRKRTLGDHLVTWALALFLGLMALARLTGSLNLSALFGHGLAAAWLTAAPSMVLIFAGLFMALALIAALLVYGFHLF